jgi:endoglycosylceramidase
VVSVPTTWHDPAPMNRTPVTRLLALVLGLLALSAGPASAATQGAYARAGRWITDDQGRVAVLNGQNVINKVTPWTVEATGFDAEDAAFLRQQGFNSIRLGLSWSAIEPTPGHYDEAYLDSIERTYDLMAGAGFSVLLNFHQDMYGRRFQGQGFPDWTVLGDARRLPTPKLGFPYNYAFSYAMQRAYDHFWSNERAEDGRRLWDAYAQLWQHVAERFRGKPQFLGYNLMNEPFAGTGTYTCFKKASGCPRFDRQRLTPFHQRVIRAIRTVDPVGLVWYAPVVTFNFGVTTSHGDVQDDRAGFGFNTYCQYTPTNWPLGIVTYYLLRHTCGQLADLVLDQADAQAAKYDDSVLMTEWGGADNPRLFEVDAQRAEQHMMSWEQWSYWNADPSGKRTNEGLILDPHDPPTGNNVRMERLKLSARVHPNAVAGTPTGWSFRPTTRRFSLTYTTLRPAQTTDRFPEGSETVVAIPEVHYPADYAVTLTGARVTSEPGARELTIASCPGAQSVSVSVAPGTTAAAARTCG